MSTTGQLFGGKLIAAGYNIQTNIEHVARVSHMPMSGGDVAAEERAKVIAQAVNERDLMEELFYVASETPVQLGKLCDVLCKIEKSRKQ